MQHINQPENEIRENILSIISLICNHEKTIYYQSEGLLFLHRGGYGCNSISVYQINPTLKWIDDVAMDDGRWAMFSYGLGFSHNLSFFEWCVQSWMRRNNIIHTELDTLLKEGYCIKNNFRWEV